MRIVVGLNTVYGCGTLTLVTDMLVPSIGWINN